MGNPPDKSELEKRLKEALRAVDYYKRISEEAANIRLREAESLSMLIARQKETEEALLRRDAILQAVSFAAEQFLRAPFFEGVMQTVLKRLGEATGVSHVYVSRNSQARDGTTLTSGISEWAAPGIERRLDNPDLQGFSYRQGGFASWEETLSIGRMIVGRVGEFPGNQREFLSGLGMKSILIVPVFVGGEWWGFIGFDDCRLERMWQREEIDSLKAAADILGAAAQQTLDRGKIEAASRAKSDFLANMSHELRTPLNHIMGFTELVLDEKFGPINPSQKEYLNDVLQSSNHLLSLINDILDLSKVESGKMELEPTDVRIDTFLDKSMLMVKEKAMKHGIRLSSNVDPRCGLIRADERKLKQILYNLLSNAVKFTPDGGEVKVSADRLNPLNSEDKEGWGRIPSEKIEILRKDFTCTEGFLHISVSDSGIGIHQKDLHRIFNPFEQADGSSSRKYQGTGLGLSLTRRLVELHGGEIWAESEGEGRGAAFRLILPLDQDSRLKTSHSEPPRNL